MHPAPLLTYDGATTANVMQSRVFPSVTFCMECTCTAVQVGSQLIARVETTAVQGIGAGRSGLLNAICGANHHSHSRRLGPKMPSAGSCQNSPPPFPASTETNKTNVRRQEN